jgi:hypothetical protein
MWTSFKLLAKGVVAHWYQSLGGTAMAIAALVADIRDWTIPPRVWLTMSGILLLGAIVQTFHELRKQCDAAMDGLVEKRNLQRIADLLTEQHSRGIHELLHKAPPWPKTQNAKEAFSVEANAWIDRVDAWNADVKQLMLTLECTSQEVSAFWTISELKPGMMVRGDAWEKAVRLHETRIDRLWAIIASYADKAESLKRARA